MVGVLARNLAMKPSNLPNADEIILLQMIYQDAVLNRLSPEIRHEEVFYDLANTPNISYRTKLGALVNIEQSANIENSTGGIVWETAYLLASYLENNLSFKSNKDKPLKILEVGAGCGLLGIVLAHSGCHVTCTETSNTMKTLEKNIKLNKKSIQSNNGKIKSKLLRWEEAEDRNIFKAFDVIIGTDIFFRKELVIPLLETMNSLSKQNTEVYLCFQIRCPDAHEEFLAKSSQYFSKVDDQTHLLISTPMCECAQSMECFLFHLSNPILRSGIPFKKGDTKDVVIDDYDNVLEQKKRKKAIKKPTVKEDNANFTPSSSSTSSSSSSSWMSLAFANATNRADDDVVLPPQMANDNDDEEDSKWCEFKGKAVANVAQSWIRQSHQQEGSTKRYHKDISREDSNVDSEKKTKKTRKKSD